MLADHGSSVLLPGDGTRFIKDEEGKAIIPGAAKGFSACVPVFAKYTRKNKDATYAWWIDGARAGEYDVELITVQDRINGLDVDRWERYCRSYYPSRPTSRKRLREG